ncbi:homeobox protein PKNOX1.1 isoform X3 [Kryptolebias marmoratus]|uniref:homeobox protein PKNOX1.1 isoform X3 n=1 Tax=Kryptolebias marmoratus TaxID=37003 RepID=UPI0007F8CBD9|nr:homeobox protein PKNOX1.1 isoform X3 [Kryptolebias marmoratus]XP_017276712.1 homeobox protein PKNOX1.1 isoform X3 [Kryptolebias marmoratus]XP_017276713.1 homeobox protein PKNOX1.1 isoform X3 [Kryptolebias marmoratus]
MAAQSVSIDKYPKGEQQMQSVVKIDDPEQKFLDGTLVDVPSPVPAELQTPMDADKASIYRHPLFPLLALLFEKCEQSTLSSDCITSASFDVDIENFVRCQDKEGKPFFSEDPELDNLMVKAIQVLRIHLLELEKVSDLCKDFCSRYIACLKTKMNSETLLSGEPGSPYSPAQGQPQNFSPTKTQVRHTPSSISGAISPQGQIVVPASALQQGNVTVTAVNPTQVVTGGTVYQPVTVVTPQGQVVTQALSPGTIRVQNNQLQLQFHQDLNLFNHDDNSTKNKRGVLPKHATNVMRSWLFQHIGHPYPTEDEKKQIATQTNLTLLQVNNWFINARRRILQPMLDASSSETPKTKKKTPQNRPLQRFWPDSIATGGGTQQQVTMPDGTMVTMNMESLQSLTSDGATLAVQQVMLGGHSEDESGDSGDEDDDADMARLGLDNSDSLQ